jgi:hypothetical protein
MAITPKRHRVPRPRLRVPRPQRWQRHRAWQQEDDEGDNADRNPVKLRTGAPHASVLVVDCVCTQRMCANLDDPSRTAGAGPK